jgi:DNA-binding NarL/FixJ family response regulator
VVAVLAAAGLAARALPPAEVADLAAAVERSGAPARAGGHRGPDVVVLDAALGGAPYARDLVAAITAGADPPAVVVVARAARPDGLVAALSAGARALVHRWCTPAELVAAVTSALAGTDLVAAPLAGLLRAEALAAASGGDSRQLSTRELQVLRGLARGATNAAIGTSLGISEHTVRNHVRAILAKLGASNRTDAVTIALRRGIVDLAG